MTWGKELFGIIKYGKEKEFKNSKNNKKCKKSKNNPIKMRMNKKMNKANKNLKNKINLKKMMKKNQILTSFKMTTKISKESEKYVNTIKKFKKIKNANLISKNKEIKSPIKLKTSTINSLKPKDNSKSTKRKNFLKSINCMSLYPLKHLKFNIWSTLITKINFKKTFQMQFYLKNLLLIVSVIESKNLKNKKLTLKKNRRFSIKSFQNWLIRWLKHPIKLNLNERITKKNNYWSLDQLSNLKSLKNSNQLTKSLIWGISTKNRKNKFLKE